MAPRFQNPCSYLPRRLQIVCSLALFIVFTILLFGSSSSDDLPYKQEISQSAHKAADYIPKHVPKISTPPWFNPFRPAAHEPPPVQANSTSGEAKWFSDWKWQNPFSSSITLDENRSVLPPLRTRTPVYTYYDSESKRDEEIKKAEHELLIVWRRAWWAKGFRPVVLGRAEAVNNPLYQSMQALQLESALATDLLRWLAWGNMGTGVLANWLALPMAPHDDALLSYLRRGEYPHLTRYEGLENGLFAGDKNSINKAIATAFKTKQPIKAETLMELVPKDTFKVDPHHEGVAFYSTNNILKHYKGLAEKLLSKDAETRAEGMHTLPKLITSHLHTIWQNTFPSGISVIKPIPDHMTTAVFTGTELARNLSQCTDSPFPASCPPNRSCKPCVSAHPLLISTPPVFRNTSSLFTIGTVPHPYTLASLKHGQDTLSTRFIRRETKRDNYILAASQELLGTGISSFARLVNMKDAIASDYGSSHSLWLTAERQDNRDFHDDLSWIFGFPIPNNPYSNGHSETPVPGPERRPPPPKPEGKVLEPLEIEKETQLLGKCREIINKGGQKGATKAMHIVEGWNLADTELWRFVRAYGARRRVERRKWEEEERKFAGGDGAQGTWGRWFDRREDDEVLT